MGALEGAEEVDDLGADGDVEGADGLVEDEEGGTEGEGAGDVDALALAAGELVGEAGEGVGVEADLGEEGVEAGVEAFGRVLAVDAEGLGEEVADAHAGVEGGEGILEDEGHAAAEMAQGTGARARRLMPSKWTEGVGRPGAMVGSSRRRTMRATVDLPEPDSPTMPRVSPRARVSETWSTTVWGP